MIDRVKLSYDTETLNYLWGVKIIDDPPVCIVRFYLVSQLSDYDDIKQRKYTIYCKEAQN